MGAPPRSTRHSVSSPSVVGRVVSVANRTATIRENPKTATRACRVHNWSPTSHRPQSAQSAWTWTPGPVSKRTCGSA
jgi:hypothetical protein